MAEKMFEDLARFVIRTLSDVSDVTTFPKLIPCHSARHQTDCSRETDAMTVTLRLCHLLRTL